ncbi:MAG TPA: hypothetical protein VFD50_08885 [Thermoleophilia bacterium]|nr:hypothetical protein [Thermoleophilia bacterium]
MSRTPTRPVQVRLPEPVDQFLTGLAHDRGESKTQIVMEALECLRQHLIERQLEAGYRDLARAESAVTAKGEAPPGEQDELVRAGIAASLPVIPD